MNHTISSHTFKMAGHGEFDAADFYYITIWRKYFIQFIMSKKKMFLKIQIFLQQYRKLHNKFVSETFASMIYHNFMTKAQLEWHRSQIVTMKFAPR